MKFRYKRYGPEIVRPVIPINITYGNRSVFYEALVDSGADSCIFDAEIGELLGIDLLSGHPETVGGITGVVETYYIHQVTLTVDGRSHRVEVGFLQNIARLGYGVLGQKGFFDIFVVTFDYVKEELELKPRRPIYS